MNLYIDIDGVLLTTKQSRVSDHALPFIDFVTNHFDCFWLTTHCKGDNTTAIKYLAKYFEGNTLDQLKKIKATDWTTLKTDAIDFSSEFCWLDDSPFQSEINILDKNSGIDKLIIVDLNRTDELKRVINLLKIKTLQPL